MIINLLANRQFVLGTDSLSVGDNGVVPRRFGTSNAWSGVEGFMQNCSAGVRLGFKTDGTCLRLSLILGECCFEFGRGDVDVFVGQERIFTAQPQGPWKDGQDFDVQVLLPEGTHEVTVYLPTYRRTLIRSFEVDDASFVEPLEPLSGSILFIGDSITQGYGATPGLCYAAQLSRQLNADYLNLGIGGACMPERLPEELDLAAFDRVVLAFGTNDANCRRDGATVARCLSGLLEQAIDGRRQIFVSSPIAWPDGERQCKRLAWEEVSEAIRKVASSASGVCYVDGSQILPWDDNCFVDGIHPNAMGMTALTQAFMEKAN